MVTIRVFSDPALMNWVGSSGASAAEAKKSTAANATTASLVSRPRRTNVMIGVYMRTQIDRRRLAVLVDRGLDVADQEVGQDRDDGQRADQRGEQRERHGQGERQEELRDETADEPERQEDRDGRQRAGGDRPGDLARTVDGRRQAILAERPVPVDVLEDDDRVVHDSAHGDREAAQGHDVDGHPGQLHDHERGQDRERDADRGDDRGADAEQEQEDRQDREDGAQATFADEAVARLLDEHGQVGDGRDRQLVRVAAPGSRPAWPGPRRPPRPCWRSRPWTRSASAPGCRWSGRSRSSRRGRARPCRGRRS